MTAAAPALPKSPTIADWMRRLKDRQSFSLHVGTFVLHRVDALVVVARPRPLDPLSTQVLNLLSHEVHPLSTERLASLLGLPHAVTLRISTALLDDGLIAGGAEHHSPSKTWSVTAAARQARKTGSRTHRVTERRSLTFLDNGDPSRPAQYVNLNGPRWGDPFVPKVEEVNFKPADICACIQQTSEWKQRRGFPTDIADLCQSSPRIPSWQNVIIDNPERCRVLLLRDNEGLHGFALDSQDWSLKSVQPYFTLLQVDAAECFPGASAAPSAEDWRQAWQDWLQSHDLPDLEFPDTGLQCDGIRFRVQVPESVKVRLAARLERDGTWLAAPSTGLHTLARIELERSPS